MSDDTKPFWLHKLPPAYRTKYGLECIILKNMPLYFISAFTLPFLLSWLAHFSLNAATEMELQKHLQQVDFMIAAMSSLIIMALILTSVGCAAVLIMKGPVRMADSYHLNDSDKPT